MQALITTDAQDVLEQGLVLNHILDEHPLQLRLSDVVRALSRGDGFDQTDRIERAVQELVKVGLLHRQGECILPTPAAYSFAGLKTR